MPPATQTRYQNAFDKFKAFASEHGLSVLPGPDVDQSLEVYLDHLWFDGRGIYDARVAVYGAAYVQRSNLKDPTVLQLARAALRGWQKRMGDVSRDPMPQQALFLACDWLCDTGEAADLSAAQALVTQFDGYFRPGEVCQVTANDIKIAPTCLRGAGYPLAAVMIAQSSEGDDGGASRRPTTKAGEQDDTVVFGDAGSKKAGRDQVAGLLAKLMAAKKGRSTPLFGLTLPEYERRCKVAFQQCGLGPLRLTPHTARHGGPSTDAALGLRGEDQIQSRGRWKARKSVLRYMKQGRLMRQINRLTPAQLLKYKTVSTTLFKKLMSF